MKHIFRTFLFALFATLFSGCISSLSRYDNYQVYYPYNPTVYEVKNCLGVWWNDQRTVDQLIMDSYLMLTYPMWIIDFPCEIVADTICLPYDIFCHRSKKDILPRESEEEMTSEGENE